jgi:hypothetical protein
MCRAGSSAMTRQPRESARREKYATCTRNDMHENAGQQPGQTKTRRNARIHSPQHRRRETACPTPWLSVTMHRFSECDRGSSTQSNSKEAASLFENDDQ